MEPSVDSSGRRPDLDRRTVLRRGAILGGTLVWAAPAVQSIAGPAFAAGSPCVGTVTFTGPGGCSRVTFQSSDDCCTCIADQQAFFEGLGFPPDAARVFAAATCGGQRRCQVASAGPC